MNKCQCFNSFLDSIPDAAAKFGLVLMILALVICVLAAVFPEKMKKE